MQKRKVVAAVLFLLALAGAAFWRFYLQNEQAKFATGTVEVTKADITAKVGGYLRTFDLKEGDRVEKSQVAAVLDRDDLKAQQTRDRAALEKARATLTDLQKGARPEELREAAANAASARSVYEKAGADYARYRSLFENGAVAKQQLDNALSAYEVAQNALAAAEEKQKLLLAGNREDTIRAQALEVERSAAVLETSKIAARDNVVYSPLTGLVLTKNFEQGEYVNPGSAIATVADLGDCWVKVYLPPAEIGRLRVGGGADVKIDAYPDRVFAGKIKEISDTAEYTPRQSITKNERTNLVFAVKVAVENGDGILKPGLPADVMFHD